MSAIAKHIEDEEREARPELPAVPDFTQIFHEMEAVLEKLPDRPRVEIIRGIFAMSPRPRVRHNLTITALRAHLHDAFGRTSGAEAPEWLFVEEAELKSEVTWTRVVPDISGWRRSTTGWPGLDESLITLMPEWVCEVLSPSNAATDRGAKLEAYGLMGIGWVWIADPQERTIETFVNIRGQMKPETTAAPGSVIQAPPFESLPVRLDEIFPG
ncbi:MAG: Uma2 family endonuclease [Thermoanaerobaculia bacterium]|nr:Uma2 family endonuclease [Thermoanaerobaculia bacterium]